MNKLLLSTLTILGCSLISLPIALKAQALPTKGEVVDTLGTKAVETKDDLAATGNGIKDTLEAEGNDAKHDLNDTGTGIKNNLETSGNGMKDTLWGVGEVPYRGLRKFFLGD